MSSTHSYYALRTPALRRFLLGNLLALLGSQMQSAAVAWELYSRTGEAIHLGYVGLVQVIPVVALALPAGQVIDRVERRRVIMAAQILLIVASLGLAYVSFRGLSIAWMYGCLFATGVARAFQQPAKSAMLPLIVPKEQFTAAVTWSTSCFQLATIVGPSLGGILIARLAAAYWIYLLDASMTAVFLVLLSSIHQRPQEAAREPMGLQSIVGGLSYVWRTKLILGAISLDMFAVLLGGATALLPVYSQDILRCGAEGYGWLRAAPGLGALLTSLLVAHGLLAALLTRAGRTLLLSVAGFGLATIVFGLSRNFWLSWIMLFATGALDMISVLIRHTVVQLRTPDAMRGRVSAVNGMFISMSNEMGAFESGLVAQLFQRSDQPGFGPTVSVVSGGAGTLLIVLLAARLFPEVRRYGRLGDETEQDETAKNS